MIGQNGGFRKVALYESERFVQRDEISCRAVFCRVALVAAQAVYTGLIPLRRSGCRRSDACCRIAPERGLPQ